MSKKVIRKTNNTLNLFADGGTWKEQAQSSAKSAFSKDNLGGTIGGIGSAVTDIVNAGIQNAQIADTSGIENDINKAQTSIVQANTNDELMNEWSKFTPMENMSWRDIRGGSTGQRIGNTIGAVGSGASAGASVGGPIGAIVGAVVGLGSAVGGWIGGNKKAKRKANKFNKQIDIANTSNLNALSNKASNIDTQNDLNAMSNFAAYGGLLDVPIGSVIDYELAKEDLNNRRINAMSKNKMTSMPNSFYDMNNLPVFAEGGNINIKPENRGKFTALKERTGKSSTWYKEHGTPAQKKMAIFALNAAKWHAEGGDLHSNGGDFSNGITVIGNGGTHEENPMMGVPMGVDSEGTPNFVEQGEVKFNDYIFSNRLFADKKLLDSVNLPISYANHSFADIAERLSKESSERPNDPISKNGLIDSMMKLRQAQEIIREQKNNRKFAKGGKLFATGGPAGIYPFQDAEEDTFIVPTGSHIIGNPLATDEEQIYSVPSSTTPDSYSTFRNKKNRNASWLRYAPVLGAGIGAATSLFSKPNYSNADLIGDFINNLSTIEYTPIGNYLTYRPFDRNYYLNKLNAQAGATRRAIMNTSSPSRNAALLAADYNTTGRIGDLARQAEEYNLAQRERVENFNRGTNQFNSEMTMRAAIANKDNERLRLQARIAQAQMRDQEDARLQTSRSANLTNFFDSLGDIGREEFSREMIKDNPALYYTIDRRGNISYKNGYDSLSTSDKKRIKSIAEADKASRKFKKGGYLTLK